VLNKIAAETPSAADAMPSDYDILQWMTAEARRAFEGACGRRRFRAGQLIYLQGDPDTEMFRVVNGAVRLFLTRFDGRQLVLLHLASGDCFGDSSLVDGDPRPQTAQAVADTEVQTLDRHAFDRLRADHRSLSDAMMRLLARQMRSATAHYASRNLDNLEARVAFTLHSAARAVDPVSDLSRLSQTELAALVGASRQRVNRVVKTLERRGLIRVSYGGFRVLDRDGLAALSG
jgi:CRP/FNR family cyclic AMP-dependent transcriptional regulator